MERKNIPVKIGWELLIPLNLIALLSIYGGISEEKWSAVIMGILIGIFVNYMFFSIRYFTDKDFLYIRNGIFGTQKINIHHITTIEKTWNPLASPAPSIFGRVEIYWPVGNFTIISPKNFEELKNALLEINPNIKIKD